MSVPFIVIASAIVLLLLVFVLLYNALVKSRNLVEAAFADIDVHLTKRSALVPNLVSLTKSYAQYESSLLLEITAKRSGQTIAETAATDAKLTQSLEKLKITVENYPDLKANVQFLQLMEELGRIEEHLVFARRFYNGTTRVFNNKVQSFPASLIAGLFGFKPGAFYSIPNAEQREAPVI